MSSHHVLRSWTATTRHSCRCKMLSGTWGRKSRLTGLSGCTSPWPRSDTIPSDGLMQHESVSTLLHFSMTQARSADMAEPPELQSTCLAPLHVHSACGCTCACTCACVRACVGAPLWISRCIQAHMCVSEGGREGGREIAATVG